jgi:hypothetical protein
MTVELYPFDSDPGNYEFWTKWVKSWEISRELDDHYSLLPHPDDDGVFHPQA